MMEFQTTFHNHSNDELANSLLDLAREQNCLASASDMWNNIIVADALLEAAKRLRE